MSVWVLPKLHIRILTSGNKPSVEWNGRCGLFFVSHIQIFLPEPFGHPGLLGQIVEEKKKKRYKIHGVHSFKKHLQKKEFQKQSDHKINHFSMTDNQSIIKIKIHFPLFLNCVGITLYCVWDSFIIDSLKANIK